MKVSRKKYNEVKKSNKWLTIGIIIAVVLLGLVIGISSFAITPIDENEIYNQAYYEGFTLGYFEGNKTGYNNGFIDGNLTGYENGFIDGNLTGYENGNLTGYNIGMIEGINIGYLLGFTEGNTTGYITGFIEGYLQAYAIGYDLGYYEAYQLYLNSTILFQIELNPFYQTSLINKSSVYYEGLMYYKIKGTLNVITGFSISLEINNLNSILELNMSQSVISLDIDEIEIYSKTDTIPKFTYFLDYSFAPVNILPNQKLTLDLNWSYSLTAPYPLNSISALNYSVGNI